MSDSGADVTVATIEIPTQQAAKQFGVIEVDKDWRIVGFQEKPAAPKESPLTRPLQCVDGHLHFQHALDDSDLLADSEDPKSAHDFGKDICRASSASTACLRSTLSMKTERMRCTAGRGTLDAYYEANMDLVSVSPIFNLYDKDWPLRTWQHQYPPAKFVFADPERMGVALDSIVAAGRSCRADACNVAWWVTTCV